MFSRDIVLDQTYQETFNDLSHPDTLALVSQAQQAVGLFQTFFENENYLK